MNDQRYRAQRTSVVASARIATSTKMLLAATIGMLFVVTPTTALQLSMVASRPSRPSSPSFPRAPSITPPFFMPSVPGTKGGVDISSSLISQLAVAALKRRLAAQTHVGCDLSFSSTDLLLGGRVGPVTVTGRGWQSGLGLTCRAIEATVETCELDMGRILTSQKLVLTKPAKGNAKVALNAKDFGNFINHPLMKPPLVPHNNAGTPAEIKFIKEGTRIDTKKSAVIFYATFADQMWMCVLRRAGNSGQAIVNVVPKTTEGDWQSDAKTLSEALSRFFNEMVFELDGTFLSFRDMMITTNSETPNVVLSLSILVHKFPSPGLAF